MKPSSSHGSHGGCTSVPLQEQIYSDLDNITRFYSSRNHTKTVSTVLDRMCVFAENGLPFNCSTAFTILRM